MYLYPEIVPVGNLGFPGKIPPPLPTGVLMPYCLFLVLLLTAQEAPDTEAAPFTGRAFWGNVVGTDPQKTGTPSGLPASASLAASFPKTEVLTLPGHAGPVESVVFSADSRNIITGGSDRQLILWDALIGGMVRKYQGNRAAIVSIAASKNGKHFVSVSTDRRVLLWDIDSETPLEELPPLPFEPGSVAISSDATQIAAGLMDGRIALYQRREGLQTPSAITFKGHVLAVNQIRFSPDENSFLTCGNDRAVFVWETLTQQMIQSFRKHRGTVLCADFSPDGQEIVSAGADHTALLWTIADGEIKYRLPGHVGEITEAAFSADGSEIYTASRDRTVLLWDAKTGEKKGGTPRRNSPILTADRNEINNSIVIGCVNGSVEILASSVFVPEDDTFVNAGSLPSAVSRHSVSNFPDLPQGQVRFRYGATSHYSDHGTVSADGLQFVSINTNQGEGMLWETDSGKMIRLLSTPQQISAARFHTRDSKFLLTGSKNGAIQYWNLLQGTTTHFPGHESAVQAVAVTPDGTRFLSGAADGTVILWNLLERTKLQTIQASRKKIRSLAFSPDGRHFAVGAEDSNVGLWTIGTEDDGNGDRLTEQKLAAHDSGDVFVVFSPDGNELYSAASDQRILQWDVASGRLLKEFKGHTDALVSIVVSPNGQYLLTGGKFEEFSLLWEVSKLEPVMVLPFQGGPVTEVLFHPKSLNVITVGGRTPLLWDISEIR